MATDSPIREDTPEVEVEAISFADFIQNSPPGTRRVVMDFEGVPPDNRLPNYTTVYVPSRLQLHCERCDDLRAFRPTDTDVQIRGIADIHLHYQCSNCQRYDKTFSIHVEPFPEKRGHAEAYKYGEMPPFGVPVPNRLLKMLGKQRDNFLKGRRCENQGLGIGAFAYYRRVVESQKNEILDEMIAVSRKQNASAKTIAALEEAKSEIQFSKAVSSVKLGLPDSILINSHNPLTLLHSALSAGVHEHTDERCLELAQAVRLVLVELAERLTQALKNEAELNTAVSRLLKARDPSG